MKIKNIWAIEVLDSRGDPTVRAFVELENGIVAKASVSSGASTGSHEALELRDNDLSRFHGKGVLKAVENVNKIIKSALVGFEIEDLEKIDKKMLELDGTEDKSSLGANAILSVSLSSARALAKVENKPLWRVINEYYFNGGDVGFPRLMSNVVNGGAHAGFNFDLQEYLVLPKTGNVKDDSRLVSEIYHSIKNILKEKGLSTLVGDEGGFSPELENNEAPFSLIIQAAEKLGYENGRDFQLGFDAAATEFFENGKYKLKKEGRSFSREELLEFYRQLVRKYSIYSLEDPFAEDDWGGFSLITKELPDKSIVGDDIFVTNIKRLEKGIKLKAANAILIKPNQIGTLFETVETIKMAKSSGFRIAISHRSGETVDTFISDLAIASAADFIKTGAPARSDRVEKYNRLLEIYEFEM